MWRKHPHGRGEDDYYQPKHGHHSETPPRAWGRPLPLQVVNTRLRNTPTGVGKTFMMWIRLVSLRKHPHGRGEDHGAAFKRARGAETPPRAWGRLVQRCVKRLFYGNTPTGVGKTCCAACKVTRLWKHPHGRGEDVVRISPASSMSETPPRAWGRHSRYIARALYARNTPTGVGKTLLELPLLLQHRKHPHGRGEDCHRMIL